jgi:hypothetical protein
MLSNIPYRAPDHAGASAFEDLLATEQAAMKFHAKRYALGLTAQWVLLVASAVSGAITAFAATTAAHGSRYADPDLLFWAGVVAALSALFMKMTTGDVAKQRARRDFHRMIIGKLTRSSATVDEARQAIEQYFERWRS